MKVDVRVLCENALRYYRSSGAQYKEAARLWSFAKKQVFTRETFTEMMPQFPPLTLDDLGLEVLIGEKRRKRRKQRQHKAAVQNGFSGLSSLLNSNNNNNKPVKREAAAEVDEEEENESSSSTEQPWSREEILRAAEKALRQEKEEEEEAEPIKLEEAEARWSLEPRRKMAKRSHQHHLSNGQDHHHHHPLPPPAVLLTRQRSDGSTSLPFVVPPSRSADPDDPEAAAQTLGAMVGRLAEGTRSVPVPKEAEYNRVRVMQLLPEAFTLPFSSHLPLLGATAGGGSGGAGGGGAGGGGGGGGGRGSTVLNLEDSSLLLNEFGGCEEQFRETIQR